MEYITAKQAAGRWGISDRRVRFLCAAGRIDGAIEMDGAYLIPADAPKPVDARTLRGFRIPEGFAKRFANIDAIKADMDNHRPLTQGESLRLKEEFMIEFTYNSNAIEGNALTLKETALVLQGLTIDQKPLKDHLEAAGHRDAFLFVRGLVTDAEILTERIIKDIHSLVLIDRPEDKGAYRRIPVRIAGAHQEPPEPYMIPQLMEQLVKWNSKARLHPIELAAEFHLRFEGIHPFVDGNGRTGRLLMNLMLMQSGYPPINVKFQDRKRYYDAFDSYYKDNSSGPMVDIIAGYIEKELLRIRKILI